VVDGIEAGEGLADFPAADGGAADEDEIGSGRRAFGEGLFELPDIGFPAFRRFFFGGGFFIEVCGAGGSERAGVLQQGGEQE